MAREDLKKTARSGAMLALIAATVALAGCGGSDPPATSVIDLTSAGVQANGVTRPDMHCGWGSIWVPLEWKGVPDGTQELAIYIGRFKYVKEHGTRRLAVPYGDLLSHLQPSLNSLAENVLPEGTGWSVTGRISCPLAAKGQRVLIAVFALDRKQAQRPLSNELAVRLTEEALAKPKPIEGPRSPGELTVDAAAVGRLIITYPGPHDAALYQ